MGRWGQFPEAKNVEIKVVENLLNANAAVAAQVRRMLEERNIFSVNIIGSPGCGKTTILERSLPLLGDPDRILVLVGDLETTNDAERIGRRPSTCESAS